MEFVVVVLCDRQDIHHMMYESFAGGALCFRIFNGTNQFGCSSKNNLDLGLRIYNLKKEPRLGILSSFARSLLFVAMLFFGLTSVALK